MQITGKVMNEDKNWMMKKKNLGNAKFMPPVMPVRRNVIVEERQFL